MSDQNLETPVEHETSVEPSQEELSRELVVRRRLKIAIAALAAVLVALLIFTAWTYYFGPLRSAQSALDGATASRGAITAVNTSLETFEGQKLDRANVAQKGLASAGELTSPPAFIFTNGKENADREVMDFYFDFADQRSRDALISNSISLRALVESGKIELRLHPLFGGRAYSMYAAEALSEVFAADSELAWDSLMVLLRNSPALASLDSNDEIVNGIVSGLSNAGVKAVDEESIKNGTFATWLLSIGNDPALSGSNAPGLPYILVGDRPLGLSVEQLNDPDAFKRAVLREIS